MRLLRGGPAQGPPEARHRANGHWLEKVTSTACAIDNGQLVILLYYNIRIL